MASRSALTEEGRTRIRNFSGRLTRYLALWILLGAAVVTAGIWMRTRYGYPSLPDVYWMCFLPLPVIVIIGMIASAKLDLRINSAYEEGRLLRGIRLLKHTEYARETKQISGLGLPVLRPEGG